MEIFEGEELYACIFCDEELENNERKEKNIEKNNNEIILQISKDINNEDVREAL